MIMIISLILFVRTVQNTIFTYVNKTNFLCLIYLTDKFCISLFTNAKYYVDESVTLPVFFVFLLQVKSCYGSGG